MKLLKRFLPLAALAVASCNPPPPPEPAVEVAAATPASTAEPVAKPKVEMPGPKPSTPEVAVQPKKEEAAPAPPAPPPPMFPFPQGEAGKLLPNVVRPPMPAMPTAEKFGVAPKERAVPRLTDPDTLPKLVHSAPPLMTPPPPPPKPTAPPERVPLDLGFGASAVPVPVRFPEAPGILEKARDVNLPPDLPPVPNAVPDRASLDDPTAEPGNAVIITKSPVPSLGIAAFLKVVLPDPFELGEQVKPKLPPMAEPGAAPVVVNPQRMK